MHTIGACKNCPLYVVAGRPLSRVCLSIEVNGRIVGTFRIVRYIRVSTVEGIVHVHCKPGFIQDFNLGDSGGGGGGGRGLVACPPENLITI